MFGMSSYEKVYMMRKSFTHVDTLFKWHLICLFSPSIQEPSDYSCLEGPGWTLPTLPKQAVPLKERSGHLLANCPQTVKLHISIRSSLAAVAAARCLSADRKSVV